MSGILDTDEYEEMMAKGSSYLDVKKRFSNVFFLDDRTVDPSYFFAVFIGGPFNEPEYPDFIEDNLDEVWPEFALIINILYNSVKNVRISFLQHDSDFIQKYNIKSQAPTFILFKNGKEIKRFDSEYTKISDLIIAYNENS